MAVIGSVERAGRVDRRGRPITPTRDLGAYLRGEYLNGAPLKLTERHPTKTGYELSDRIVSRLEIANAVRLLPYRQRRIVEMVFEQGLSRQQACHALSISDATFHREKAAALRTIVGAVYEWGVNDPEEGAA